MNWNHNRLLSGVFGIIVFIESCILYLQYDKLIIMILGAFIGLYGAMIASMEEVEKDDSSKRE